MARRSSPIQGEDELLRRLLLLDVLANYLARHAFEAIYQEMHGVMFTIRFHQLHIKVGLCFRENSSLVINHFLGEDGTAVFRRKEASKQVS